MPIVAFSDFVPHTHLFLESEKKTFHFQTFIYIGKNKGNLQCGTEYTKMEANLQLN